MLYDQPHGTSGWWLCIDGGIHAAHAMTDPALMVAHSIVGYTYDPAVVIKFLRGEALPGTDYEVV